MENSTLVDLDAERSLTSEAIREWDRFLALDVRADDFGSPACRIVVSSAFAVHEAGSIPDYYTISLELKRAKKLESIGGEAGLAELAAYSGIPDPSKVTQLAKLRRLQSAADDIRRAVEMGSVELAAEALSRGQDSLEKAGSVVIYSARDLVEQVFEAIHDDAKNAASRVHPGLDVMADVIGHLPVGSCTVIAADTNTGKAVRTNTPVLTTHGWERIGSLRVGDEVIAVDGTPTPVVGVFPQGVRDLYKVTFCDGSEIDADLEHRWAVTTDLRKSRGKPYQVMTTKEIMEAGVVKGGRKQWSVPTVSPVQFEAADLPIDPYVMGVILGDGHIATSVSISKTEDMDIMERVASLLPDGVRVSTSKDGSNHTLTYGQNNPVMSALRDMGLGEARSHTKFIPRMYLMASVKQRSELLRGLLDTDGTTNQSGVYLGYCTVSPALRSGVVELVQSLGGVAKVSERVTRYTHKGEKRDGRLSYNISLAMPPEFVPFHATRKAAKFKPRTCRMPTRKIASIVKVDSGEAVCIAVAHESSLFVVKNYIVTHNSQFALAMLLGLVERDVTCGMISTEDPAEVTGSRILANYSGISSRRIQLRKLDKESFGPLKTGAAMASSKGRKLLFADCVGGTELDVCAAMYAMAREGAKLVVVDYLTEIEASKRQQDRRNEIRWVASKLKRCAKKCGVALVLVSQISRPADKDSSKRPGKHHLKESGDVSNAAEVIIVLWRESEDDAAPVKAWVAKCKWGGVGQQWTMRRNRSGMLVESEGTEAL